MAKKRYTPEQIVAKIREAEVELSKGQTTPQVCKKLGVSEQTYYRWRREYGGLRLEQAKRLKTRERENTRECLAIHVGLRMRCIDVLEHLSDLSIARGVPEHIRSDNGPEFTGKFRDEPLDRETFYTLAEVNVLVEMWRREYDTVRPHSASGYRPPAPPFPTFDRRREVSQAVTCSQRTTPASSPSSRRPNRRR